MADFDGTISAVGRLNCIFVFQPLKEIDSALDVTIDATGFPISGTGGLSADWVVILPFNGVISATGSLDSDIINVGTFPGGISAIGEIPPESKGYNYWSIPTVTQGKGGTGFVESNFAKWSNIGEFNFVKGLGNIAGKAPMEYKGFIFANGKLGNAVISYGENGITRMVRQQLEGGVFWGQTQIIPIGIENKLAMTATLNEHYFVCTDYNLYKIGLEGGVKKLGYEEYLQNLDCMVLSYDNEYEQIYICDGITGYIYDIFSGSMGEGPPNVTGVSFQDGTKYVTAPASITTPVFEICTDIQDLGTRKMKTIYKLELGTNISGTFQAAIDFRKHVNNSFSTTAWKTVPDSGVVRLYCQGREFRLKAKLASYEYFELDYFNVKGITHAR